MTNKPIQLFGTIDTPEGVARAMLCVDADRPHEFMIHKWGMGQPFALLMNATTDADGSFILKPKNLYKPSENGTLQLNWPTEDEAKKLKEVSAQLRWDGDELRGEWTGLDKTARAVELKPGPQGVELVPSELASWEAFKQWAATSRKNLDAFLFRGHGSKNFKLETTLHRAGRCRLERYTAETLQQFHAQAEAALDLRLDLNDGSDYSVVLGLGQHHGLPTPLLDWTESPYIAAFFAFAEALEAEPLRPHATHVRIFALTREFVEKTSPSFVVLLYMSPYVCQLQVVPRHNQRLQVQQGRFLVTNVGNLKLMFGSMPGQNKPYLHAIDIPISAARDALEDLAFMGVTAATMFPGLDGICRKLRHQMVFVQPPIAATDSRQANSIT